MSRQLDSTMHDKRNSNTNSELMFEDLPQDKTFDKKNLQQQTFGVNTAIIRTKKEDTTTRNFSVAATELGPERRIINKQQDSTLRKTRENSQNNLLANSKLLEKHGELMLKQLSNAKMIPLTGQTISYTIGSPAKVLQSMPNLAMSSEEHISSSNISQVETKQNPLRVRQSQNRSLKNMQTLQISSMKSILESDKTMEDQMRPKLEKNTGNKSLNKGLQISPKMELMRDLREVMTPNKNQERRK